MDKKKIEENDITGKIEDFKKRNNEINKNTIENPEELREAYEEAKALYKEIMKNLPLVTNEMTKRGMNLVINEVGKKIDDAKAGAKRRFTAAKTKVTDKGQEIKETVKDKAQKTKEGIESGANAVKKGIKDTAKNAKNKVVNAKDRVQNTIDDVRDSLEEDELYKSGMETHLKSSANKEKKKIENWKESKSDRNKTIVNAVEKISLSALKMKTIKNSMGIKLTTVATKGARLTGNKSLAEQLAKRRINTLNEEMGKDTRVGRFARNLAGKIFEKTDKAKAFVTDKKEAIITGKDKVEKFIKEDAVQGVKQGAFAIGKAGYKGAALFAGLGELAIEGVKGAAIATGEKVGNVAKDVGEKVNEKAEEIKETAINKIDIGANYIDMANKKIQLNQTKAKMGIKGFFKNIAQGVVNKLEPSLDKDKSAKESLEQGINNNRANINNIKNKNNGEPEPEMG